MRSSSFSLGTARSYQKPTGRFGYRGSGPPEYQPPPAYWPPSVYGFPVEARAAVLPVKRINWLALSSMICGTVGVVLFFLCTGGFLGGVPALVMGFIARSRIKHLAGMQSGSWMALTGIIAGAVACGLSVVFWGFAFFALAFS